MSSWIVEVETRCIILVDGFKCVTVPRQQQQRAVANETLRDLSEKLKALPCYDEPDEDIEDHYVSLKLSTNLFY